WNAAPERDLQVAAETSVRLGPVNVFRRAAWALFTFVAAVDCTNSPTPAAQKPPTTPALTAASPALPPTTLAAAETGPPPVDPVVVVAEPSVLKSLERSGFDFGSTVTSSAASSAKGLAERPAYRALVDAVTADLAADRRSDRSAGVGMRFSHRQFDVRWLSS